MMKITHVVILKDKHVIYQLFVKICSLRLSSRFLPVDREFFLAASRLSACSGVVWTLCVCVWALALCKVPGDTFNCYWCSMNATELNGKDVALITTERLKGGRFG